MPDNPISGSLYETIKQQLSNLRFLIFMSLGSALGFGKLLFLAYLLPLDGLGNYTSFLGGSLFLSMLLSFGLVEETTKNFPRLWADNRIKDIWQRFGEISKTMFGRACIFACLFLPFMILKTEYNHAAWIFILFLIVSYNNNIVASIIRAIGNINVLIAFTLVRNGLSFLILTLTAYFFKNWTLLFGLECCVGFITLLYGLYVTRKLSKNTQNQIESAMGSARVSITSSSPHITKSGEVSSVKDKGGRQLYFANLFSSAITLGDKAIITMLTNASITGAYGIIMFVIQTGQILASVIAQKIGPDMIRSVHSGSPLKMVIKQLRFPLAILTAWTLTVITAIILLSQYASPFESFLKSRHLEVSWLLIATIGILLQMFLLVEFFLIAIDKETQILKSSFTAVAICFSGFFIVSMGTANVVVGFVLCVLLARTAQLCGLLYNAKVGIRADNAKERLENHIIE